jgi:hypothetical protein
MEYFYMRDYGIGDVSLTEVSQTAMATINSIRQNGEGDLTLTAGYYDAIDEDSLGGYEDEYVFLPEDFVQTIENLDLLVSAANAGPDDLSSSALNFAEASTNVGDVAISELSQQAQFGFNSITSGGDIEGWNALDRYGIVQIGGSDSYDASLSAAHTNFIYGRTSLGDVDVAGLEQIANVSMNHVYAGNDLGANLTQLSEFQVAATDDVNDVLLVSLAKGGLVLDELTQVAALRMNSVSVVDEISSMALVQDADNLGELSYSEGINDVSARWTGATCRSRVWSRLRSSHRTRCRLAISRRRPRTAMALCRTRRVWGIRANTSVTASTRLMFRPMMPETRRC